MRQSTVTAAAIAGVAFLAACDRAGSDVAAAATDAPPDAVEAVLACSEFPADPDFGEPTRPVVIPPQFAAYVQASDTTLTVRRTSGPPACIDIRGSDVESLDSFMGGRLLGANLLGHEYNSYFVVDRNNAAEPIQTGVKPTFSPSGKRFASVDISIAGFGAFEALGVWVVEDASIRNLVKLEDILDRGSDWRLVRWASEDCLVFSTAADPSGVDLAERKFQELRLTDRPELTDIEEEAACRT